VYFVPLSEVTLMFSISAPAARRMTDLLDPKGDLAILRIVRRAGRFRLCVSQVRQGDMTFAHGGRDLLALDAPMQEALAAHSLSTRTTAGGPRLKLATHQG